MGLKDCLATALEGGEITKAQHDRLQKRFDTFLQTYEIDSRTTAAGRAKQAMLDELKAELAHKTKQAKITADRRKALLGTLTGFRTASGKADVGAAAMALLESNGQAVLSVARLHKSVLGDAMAELTYWVHASQRDWLTGKQKNVAMGENILREAMGEETGDATAKSIADGLEKVQRRLVQRFNAAGGAIAWLDKRGLMQRHNPIALRKRSLETWKRDIRGRLDLNRMQHPLTKTPIAQGELDSILDGIFEGITKGRWKDGQPSGMPAGKGALANQRAEHRFLVFKSADDWLAYQRDYGGGADVFDAAMSEINMMSRDIAMMEVLGPNPIAGAEWVKQVIQQQATFRANGEAAAFPGKPETAENRAERAVNRFEKVFDDMRGVLGQPVNETMAKGLGGLRNLNVASALGGAVLSSAFDMGTSMLTRRMAGIRGSVLHDYVRAALPSGRQDAIAAGLILDDALQVMHAEARFAGTLAGSGWTSMLADRVMTWSFLKGFTQAGKHAFGLSFFHEAAMEAGQSWERLHPLFRRKFAEYGFTPADWDKIRSAGVHTGESGLTLLRPAEVRAVDPGLADRWLGMVQDETEYAVVSGGHRARTFVLGKTRPGTIEGEALRSMMQFKSFPVAFAMLHGARIFRMLQGSGEEKWLGGAYAGALLITSAMFGAMTIQLKQLAQFKDPQPMTDKKFWGAALLQGGGLGIYGDFLFADLNRFGGGLASTMAGPAAQRFDNFRNLVTGNAIQLANGDETNFGRETVQFLKQNVPGASIWYLRGAMDRLVFDQLQHLVDPEANKAFKRRQQDAAKTYGQGYWWAPGQALPSRAPDFGNVAASRPPAGG